MSAAKPDPTGVDPAAREMVKALRTLVGQLMADVSRMGMQGGEEAADRYAHAYMDEIPISRLPTPAAVHDKLAAAPTGISLRQRNICSGSPKRQNIVR